MPATPQENQQLMLSLQQGDESTLSLLIDQWERPLFNFSYRYVQNEQTAREIVEETIVRLFSKRDSYNPQYPLSSWIFTIAANLCKNHIRWKKRHPEHSWNTVISKHGENQSWEDSLATTSPSPIDETETKEDLNILRESIEQLPHDLKIVLLLHYYEGLSYKEISHISNCSVRGVESRLYRARKQLKTHCEAATDR